MRRCKHSEWLTLHVERGDSFLLESNRLQILLDENLNDDIPAPSLFVLLGDGAESAAVQALTPNNNDSMPNKKGKRSRSIHLHRGDPNLLQGRQMLIADGEFPYRLSKWKRSCSRECHETTRLMLPRTRQRALMPNLLEATDSLYNRLLSPFTDGFCFFSTESYGFESLSTHLALWLEKESDATYPKVPPPWILVVVQAVHPSFEAEKQLRSVLLRALKEKTSRDLSEHFSGIDLLTVSQTANSTSGTCYDRLRERIVQISDQQREKRTKARVLFSARHYAALFKHASEHFASTRTEPFNFIRSSRIRNPVSSDLDLHFSNFLKNVNSSRELVDFGVPVIASSLILDQYPPGMHSFKSTEVFHTLYRDVCYKVSNSELLTYNGTLEIVLPSGFVKMVEVHFTKLFDELIHGKPAAKIHANTLRSFRRYWQRIKSDETCLSCLNNGPETGLPCGHIICENCPFVLGSPNKHDRWVSDIHACFLCQLELKDIKIKRLSDTGGINALSLDGGGIKGVIQLQLLKILQDRIGLPIPIQEHFHMAFGTSIGAKIILGIIVQALPVDDCITIFRGLASTIFKPRWLFRIPVLSHIPIISPLLEVLFSYLADGLYPVDKLEAVLQELYGKDRSILDYSRATAMGTKVGIPVSTVSGAESCIFTNYNGVGKRSQDCGYYAVRSRDGARRIRLWEIARCASAAPWFFAPKDIPEVDTFQDGALWKQNPEDLVFWEIPVVWPRVRNPNLVLSVGTGSIKTQTKTLRRKWPLRIWRDGVIPRLYRAFEGFLDGRKMAQAFKNRRRMDLEGRYFRFDVDLDEQLNLDHAHKISELELKAQQEFSISPDIDTVARIAIASKFYFELESKPTKIRGKYLGTGLILCDLARINPAFGVLFDQLSRCAARFLVDEHSIRSRFDVESFFDNDGNFQVRVEFCVRDKISILLKEMTSPPQHISGSPYLIDDMIEAQGFNDVFGRSDHRKRKCAELTPSSRSKRRRIHQSESGF